MHWTKTTDNAVIAPANAVQWRLTYIIFESSGTDAEDGAAAPTIVTVDDTYDSAEASAARIVYRTANIPIVGAVAGYYLSVGIEATNATTLANDPALFSVDMMFDEYILR